MSDWNSVRFLRHYNFYVYVYMDGSCFCHIESFGFWGIFYTVIIMSLLTISSCECGQGITEGHGGWFQGGATVVAGWAGLGLARWVQRSLLWPIREKLVLSRRCGSTVVRVRHRMGCTSKILLLLQQTSN